MANCQHITTHKFVLILDKVAHKLNSSQDACPNKTKLVALSQASMRKMCTAMQAMPSVDEVYFRPSQVHEGIKGQICQLWSIIILIWL